MASWGQRDKRGGIWEVACGFVRDWPAFVCPVVPTGVWDTESCTVAIASLKMFASLTHEKQCVVVLNFINLVASEVEHFFLVLLINFISSFVNLLSVSFFYDVCVRAQVNTYLCEGQWLVPNVFLSRSLPYFLSQGLSLSLELLGLPRLAGQ